MTYQLLWWCTCESSTLATLCILAKNTNGTTTKELVSRGLGIDSNINIIFSYADQREKGDSGKTQHWELPPKTLDSTGAPGVDKNMRQILGRKLGFYIVNIIIITIIHIRDKQNTELGSGKAIFQQQVPLEITWIECVLTHAEQVILDRTIGGLDPLNASHRSNWRVCWFAALAKGAPGHLGQ